MLARQGEPGYNGTAGYPAGSPETERLCCAAVLGTTIHRMRAPPTVTTGTIPTTVTTISVFGCCVRPRPIDFRCRAVLPTTVCRPGESDGMAQAHPARKLTLRAKIKPDTPWATGPGVFSNSVATFAESTPGGDCINVSRTGVREGSALPSSMPVFRAGSTMCPMPTRGACARTSWMPFTGRGKNFQPALSGGRPENSRS